MAQNGELPQNVEPEAPPPVDNLTRVQRLFQHSHALNFDGVIKTDVADWTKCVEFFFESYEVEPHQMVGLARSSLTGLARDLFVDRDYEPTLLGWTVLKANLEAAFHPSVVYQRLLFRSFHWGPKVGESFDQYLTRFQEVFLPNGQVIPDDHDALCEFLLRSLPGRFSIHIAPQPEPDLVNLIADARQVIAFVLEHEAENQAAPLLQGPPPAPSTPARERA